MHTEKHKMSNCGLLKENDRSMYTRKDCTSNSLINPELTHLNYNICPHAQYTPEEIKARIEIITGKTMRKDGVAFGTTIITAPEEVKNGNTEAFFQIAYEGMKSILGLRDKDIVSAYVHLDETTPHMHFNFIPHVYGEKETVSWDRVMSREKYKTQHKDLQEYFKSYGYAANLLNGKTKGIDFTNMTAKEKELYNRVESLGNSVKALETQNTSLQGINNALKLENANLEKKHSKLMSLVKGIFNELKRESIFPNKGHKEKAQDYYEKLITECEELDEDYER